jgi:glutathione peroxidase
VFFQEIDIDGNEVRFEKFRDKIVFVMNVASECGYTKSGYDFLRAMSGWRDKGLELLIYPCNQFGNQEPGSPEEIKRFAEAQGFKGTIISKSFVKGAHTRPSFKWMMDYIGGGATYQPKWNFGKKNILHLCIFLLIS